MNITQRLEWLESFMLTSETGSLKICIFGVDPGTDAISGYRCNDVVIMRKPDETTEHLKDRCHEAAAWPIGASDYYIFEPIYEH